MATSVAGIECLIQHLSHEAKYEDHCFRLEELFLVLTWTPTPVF